MNIGSHVLLAVAAACAFALGSCSTPSRTERKCDVTTLGPILTDTLAYSDRTFCGQAFAVRQAYSRVTRLLATPNDQISYDETAIVVATKGSQLLGAVTEVPTAYYIEARVEPIKRCWETPSPDNGETCVPWVRPVIFHILKARKLTQAR